MVVLFLVFWGTSLLCYIVAALSKVLQNIYSSTVHRGSRVLGTAPGPADNNSWEEYEGACSQGEHVPLRRSRRQKTETIWKHISQKRSNRIRIRALLNAEEWSRWTAWLLRMGGLQSALWGDERQTAIQMPPMLSKQKEELVQIPRKIFNYERQRQRTGGGGGGRRREREKNHPKLLKLMHKERWRTGESGWISRDQRALKSVLRSFYFWCRVKPLESFN